MERIGRYVVVSRLGSGGFATVYRADDPVLELPVAIKVLADNIAGDPDLRARFIREARTMRRLRSSRIVTVYDIAELPDGRPYLVMQLAGRGTLYDRLRRVWAQEAPAPTADLRAVVRGLGEALAVVHDAGVVHRDVKPSNVLIDAAPADMGPDPSGDGTLVGRDEVLLLGDFGLAKDLAETRRMTLAAGTLAYMAPEQRLVGALVDARADVYAASKVVAELAAGGAGASTAPGWPAVHADLRECLRRGMAEDPDARPRDARAWSTELLEVLADRSVLAERVPVGPGGGQPTEPLPPEAPSSFPPVEPWRPPPTEAPEHETPGPEPPVREAPPPADTPPQPDPSVLDRTIPDPTAGLARARPRRRRWLRAGVGAGLGVVLLAAAVLAAVSWWPAGPGPTIVGPRALVVGQQGVYYAEAAAGTGLTWTGPGSQSSNGAVFTVPAAEVGTFTVTVRTDDRTESTVTVEVGEAPESVGIDGPYQVTVDEVAVFKPEVTPPDTETHWLDGAGGQHDSDTLTVRFTSVGTLTLELVAEFPGETRTVAHTVTVVPR